MKILLRKINSLIKAILLYKVFKNSVMLNFISPNIRSIILRYCGAKIGEGVYFSSGIYIDNNAEFLEIEDNVLVSPNVTMLFHKRNMSFYGYNISMKTVPHEKMKVHIKKGASIGTNSIILPGITIGEGAVIGAGTLVSKNIPDWSIAVGNPVKIIKEYKPE